MAEETSKLDRDNTMVATAKEGEAFLETKGKPDEDAKTRGQQKGIEEITAEEDKAEIKRTTTMAETAKEGKELLDGEELGKTRSQTKNEAKNGEDVEAPEENGNGNGKGDDDDEEEDEPDSEQNGNHAEDEKSPAKRTRAKDDTVQEGEEIKKPRVEPEAEEVKT